METSFAEKSVECGVDLGNREDPFKKCYCLIPRLGIRTLELLETKRLVRKEPTRGTLPWVGPMWEERKAEARARVWRTPSS